MKGLSWFGVLLITCLPSVSAQGRFEVASVRESLLPDIEGGTLFWEPSLRLTNIELWNIITSAYLEGAQEALTHRHRMDFSKIDPGLLRKRFDIDTRGTGDQKAMLRTLLAERFGLRTHTETRIGPQYVVTVRGPSLWLKPSALNCAAIRTREPRCAGFTAEDRKGAHVKRYAGPITELLRREVIPVLRAPVADRTGLTGNYEWAIAIRTAFQEGDREPAAADALADLGLRLEKTKGPTEVIVVDAVRMPTPN